MYPRLQPKEGGRLAVRLGEKRVTLICHTDSSSLIKFEKGASKELLLFFCSRVFLENFPGVTGGLQICSPSLWWVNNTISTFIVAQNVLNYG